MQKVTEVHAWLPIVRQLYAMAYVHVVQSQCCINLCCAHTHFTQATSMLSAITLATSYPSELWHTPGETHLRQLDLNSGRRDFPMPNTTACCDELFCAAPIETLLVKAQPRCWKLLTVVKAWRQRYQSLTPISVEIPCLMLSSDIHVASITNILCHVTVTWWNDTMTFWFSKIGDHFDI